MNRHAPIPLLIAVCAAFIIPPTNGQGQSAKLDELKKQYEAEVIAAERDIKEKYIIALETIQQRLQSKAKLEAALAVKREREKIEAELAASSGSSNDPGGTPSTPGGAAEFVLKSENATPVGEVELVGKWEALTGWREKGSGAQWDLSSVPAGVYSVKLQYSSPMNGGTLTVAQGLGSFNFPLLGTGGWVTYTSMEAGQINVSNPSSPLRIVVEDDGDAPFGILNLKSVTLSKIGG